MLHRLLIIYFRELRGKIARGDVVFAGLHLAGLQWLAYGLRFDGLPDR